MLHTEPMLRQCLIPVETLKVLIKMKYSNNFCESCGYLPSLKQVKEKDVTIKKLINLR